MSEKVVQARDRGKTHRRLLAAAHELFYGGGIHATGVSAVAERAGVTKMTLYAHFSSKDDLVPLTWRTTTGAGGSSWRRSFQVVRNHATSSWSSATTREMRGCAFVNCAAEFPDPDHPARRVIRRHKAGVRERLHGLASEAGAEDPATLAERLFVVLEGAYVLSALEGDSSLLERSRALCADLVEVAVRDRMRP